MNGQNWDNLNNTLTKEFEKQLEFRDIVNEFIKKFPKNFNSFIGKQIVNVSNTVEALKPYSIGIKLVLNFEIFFDTHHPDDIGNKNITYETKIMFIKNNEEVKIHTKNASIKYENNMSYITEISKHIYNEMLDNSIDIVLKNLK